jgi:serine/threonine protein kinase
VEIGGFEVLDQIGSGGQGVVFRARDPEGRVVAIKLLLSSTPSAVARFEREGSLLADLGHGFVPLLGSGLSGGQPYLVLPFFPGGSLGDRLRRGPLRLAESLELVRALCSALARAHARGLVHRDLKPDNVLYDEDGQPWIADLGIAKVRGVDALSRTGEARGTLGYMAPEQARDAKHVGSPADLFSLGAMFYECLAGRPAFVGESPRELLVKVVSGLHDPLPRLAPKAPSALVEVIERCLDPDPSIRPTCEDLLAALEIPATRPTWPLLAIGAAVLACSLALLSRAPPATIVSAPSPAEIASSPQPPSASPEELTRPRSTGPLTYARTLGKVNGWSPKVSPLFSSRRFVLGGVRHDAARWNAETLRLENVWAGLEPLALDPESGRWVARSHRTPKKLTLRDPAGGVLATPELSSDSNQAAIAPRGLAIAFVQGIDVKVWLGKDTEALPPTLTEPPERVAFAPNGVLWTFGENEVVAWSLGPSVELDRRQLPQPVVGAARGRQGGEVFVLDGAGGIYSLIPRHEARRLGSAPRARSLSSAGMGQTLLLHGSGKSQVWSAEELLTEVPSDVILDTRGQDVVGLVDRRLCRWNPRGDVPRPPALSSIIDVAGGGELVLHRSGVRRVDGRETRFRGGVRFLDGGARVLTRSKEGLRVVDAESGTPLGVLIQGGLTVSDDGLQAVVPRGLATDVVSTSSGQTLYSLPYPDSQRPRDSSKPFRPTSAHFSEGGALALVAPGQHLSDFPSAGLETIRIFVAEPKQFLDERRTRGTVLGLLGSSSPLVLCRGRGLYYLSSTTETALQARLRDPIGIVHQGRYVAAYEEDRAVVLSLDSTRVGEIRFPLDAPTALRLAEGKLLVGTKRGLVQVFDLGW